jgi:hypothetical protein
MEGQSGAAAVSESEADDGVEGMSNFGRDQLLFQKGLELSRGHERRLAKLVGFAMTTRESVEDAGSSKHN